MNRLALVAVAALIALAATGCKKQKAPEAKRIWVGPSGGCMQTLPHPKTGTLACWGALPGDASPATAAVKRDFSVPGLSDFAIGSKMACALKEKREVYCWTADKPELAKTEDVGEQLEVKVGNQHACVRSSDTLRCFGAAGDWLGQPGEWNRNTKITAFALGNAHTCAAYENLGVQCRGDVEGDSDALAKLVVLQLAAGDRHTCALLSNHSVVCWGKNDVGQLGDRTTTDSKVPVPVIGLTSVAAIAAGASHTCALVGNGTVSCWGANNRHQLANGDTKPDGRAEMVLGALGIGEIGAAGEGTCARYFGTGEVRCWGANDRAQLGDSSLVEHTVPDAIRFQ